MADQVAGVAGGATGTGLGGLTGALQGGVGNILNTGKGYLDRWFPPEKREELSAKISKFATEKPMFASFLLSQIALSGIPLSLFVVMTIGVLVFALVAGLVIAVLGALVFTVFCVGVALIVLLPTLFITTFAGVFIWLWGLAAYYILKWFNQKDIPGIHTDLKGGLMDKSGLSDLPALNGSAEGPPPADRPPKLDRQPNGSAEKKQGGKDTGKSTGADVGGVGDAKKKADNATKVADGIKGSIPGGALG